MLMRDAKVKLKYARSVMNEELGCLVKNVFEDMYRKENSRLVVAVKRYMNMINLTELDQLTAMSEIVLERTIKQVDEREWNEKMTEMSTLSLYRQFKNTIKQELFYCNDWDSILLFRARSNSLNLNWRKGYLGGSTLCQVCGAQEEENLQHFVVATVLWV